MNIRSIWFLLFAVVMLALSSASFAQIGVSITIGPPPLPVYEQPPCPGEGFLWTPGYWAYDYDDEDYYWVPGTWVLAPEVGFFWTPGYWGWSGEGFVFYPGYWGPRVGFYGGIDYGYGYFGEGYAGGRWDHGQFFYNRSVNNVNVTEIHNVYNTTVINNHTENRISYNGGNGGINRRPTPQEEEVAHERHIPPVAVQTQHVQAARTDPQLRASINRGKPPVAATPRPAALNDRAVVPAKEAGGPYNPPAKRADGHAENNNRTAPRPENNPGTRSEGNSGARPDNNAGARTENNTSHPGNVVHPRDLPPAERPTAPDSGNSKADQKYRQQQEKVFKKQDQERQKLEQKQEQDHQRLEKQRADEGRKQQLEQRHQQQTQQLQQKHEQQQQKMRGKQQPERPKESKPPNEKP